jgi:hypothetical protein
MDEKGRSFPYSQENNKLIERAFSKECDSVDLALPDTVARIIFFAGKVNQALMGIQVEHKSENVRNVYREDKERNVSMFVTAPCYTDLELGRQALEELIDVSQ